MLTYNSFRPEVAKSYVGRQNLVYLNNFRKSERIYTFQIFLIIDDISMISVSLVYFVNYINTNFNIISLKLLFYIIFVFICKCQPIRVDISASRRLTFNVFFALIIYFHFFYSLIYLS